MRVESPVVAGVDEPIAWLRAYTDGVEPRVLPLFRRAARVTVGCGKACDWRFEAAELAELELVLAWDGVRLRAEDATVPDTRATVHNGQSIVAGATGRLRIALDLVLHDEEVTMIRKLALPPASEETTAPIPLAPAPYDDDDHRTVLTVLPPQQQPTVRMAAVSPELARVEEAPVEPPPAATVATTMPAHMWRLWVPPRNGAADDEPTAEWSLDDALRPTADLLDRLGKRGLRTLGTRVPPRRLALYGALVLVVAVEAFMLVRPRRVAPPPATQSAPSARTSAAANRRARVMLPDKDVEVALHRAIAAYRAGKSAEALTEFTRVAEDANDPAARTMLFVLRNRPAATP